MAVSAFLFASLCALTAAAQSAAVTVPGLRLPRDVVPLAYDAKLRVDPSETKFEATIDIVVRVLEPTDLVWLNAKKLVIGEVSGRVLAAPDEAIPATVVPGSDDVIGLRFEKALPAGEARIAIAYTGSIERRGAIGLFGQQEAGRWYAVTQFEPMDARRVFPCFDEPDRKAPWKLTLTVPEAARAFANMPVETERTAGTGWREFGFQRSPPLPTYLVAFAVGEFDVRDAGRAGRNQTPISIITPKGRAGEAAYAAKHTGSLLAAAENYFGRPYPFPKLDLLAYPTSTFGGAMENPGLITYTSRLLLAKPDEMSALFEQRMLGVTAHEIAHLWFGDYVTMSWWDDLWLNEAFASWMGSTLIAQVRPDWPRGGWRSHQRGRAIGADRLDSARRIRAPVTEYGDVRAAFDDITYAKGEVVLAMFEQWLGAEKFRDGVRTYMGKHAWGNATAEDFFSALAATDDALVPAFRGFVERAGVPLLDVALDCRAAPALRLRQQRFVPAGSRAAAGDRWVFPACFDFGDAQRSRQVCALVRDAEQTVPLPVASCPQWVVANRSGVGYYLPRLSPTLYAALPKAERVLAAADYELMLGDLELLTNSGAIGFRETLTIAAQQAANGAPGAARRAYELVDSIPSAMIDPGNEAKFAAWIRSRFGDRARSLGWISRKGDDSQILRLRQSAVPLVTNRGQDAALARKAQQLAQRWLTHRSAIPPDSRRMVLVAAARGSGKAAPRLYAELLAIAQRTPDTNERTDVYIALGSFRDPQVLARALALTLDTRSPARETIIVLREALADDATRQQALTWFAANFAALSEHVPREMHGAWPVWAGGACTISEREQFVALFGAQGEDRENGSRRYRETLERVNACLAMREAQQAPFNAFLVTLR